MPIDGQWSDDRLRTLAVDESGRFVRQESGFRNWITPHGDGGPTGQGGFPVLSMGFANADRAQTQEP